MLGAQRLYDRSRGDIYAAAITYFTVFAIFPLLMMAFAVVGFVLASRPDALAEIDERVKSTVSGDYADQVLALMDSAIASRASVGVIGLCTAAYAGLGWIQRLREALSRMWGQPPTETGFVKTKLSDLAALASAFAAGAVTIGLTALADPAARLAGGLRVVSLLGSILVAWGLFTWMIGRLPRQPAPLRSCAQAGLIAAVGFELFKQVASVYLRLVLHGPAGVTFGPVLGLMVFAYMTARLVLFATAWAATRHPAGSASGPPE